MGSKHYIVKVKKVQDEIKNLNSISEKFGTILLDAPWRFINRTGKVGLSQQHPANASFRLFRDFLEARLRPKPRDD